MATNNFTLQDADRPPFFAALQLIVKALAQNSISATAPPSPNAGQLWMDSTANILKIRNIANTAWSEVSEVSGSGNGWMIQSGTPASPIEGTGWWDTSTGVDALKIYDGSAWIEIGPGGGPKDYVIQATAPTAISGKLWFDTTAVKLKIYDGSSWNIVDSENGAITASINHNVSTTGKQVGSDPTNVDTTWSTVSNYADGAITGDLEAGPIKCLSLNETWYLQTSGVCVFDYGTSVEVQYRVKFQYCTSDTQNGSYSSWKDVKPMTINTGGDAYIATATIGGNLANMSTMFDQVNVQVPIKISVGMEDVTANQFIKIRTQISKATGHPTIKSRMGFFISINAQQNANVGGWLTGDTDPATGTDGAGFYNTSTNVLKIWNGTSYQPAGGAVQGATTVTQSVIKFIAQTSTEEDLQDVANTTFQTLHTTGTTEMITPAMQVLNTNEIHFIKTMGVNYCSRGTLTAIGIECRMQYQFAATENPASWSTWANVEPGYLEDDLFYRTKLAAGGSGNTQYRDVMPAIEFPIVAGTAMPRISSGSFVRLRLQTRLPADSGFPTLDKRYGFTITHQANQEISVLATVPHSSTSARGVIQLADSNAALAGTDEEKAMTAKLVVDSIANKVPASNRMPISGTQGQIIQKTGSADGAVGWVNPYGTGVAGVATYNEVISTAKTQIGVDNDDVQSNNWGGMASLETNPIQCKNTNEIWRLTSQGTINFGTVTEETKVILNSRFEYSICSKIDGEYSSFIECASRTRDGFTDSGALVFSPTHNQTVPVLSELSSVIAGDWVKIRIAHAPENISINYRSDFFVSVEATQPKSLNATIADATVLHAGAVTISSEDENNTGTATDKTPNVLGVRSMFGNPLYKSDETDFVQNRITNFAHGLARAPLIWEAYLICKTTQHGFAAGDMLNVKFLRGASQATVNGTNIKIRADNTAWNQITNAAVTLTDSSWKYIVVAY